MSTVFTMVLPAYTTADPVTSTTATVVEQAFKNMQIKTIDSILFIFYKTCYVFFLFFLCQRCSDFIAFRLLLTNL